MSLISSNGLQNQSEILKRNLQKINYQQQLTFQIFQDKNPIVFLQILHYMVINYNVDFYKSLIDKGYELFSKSDQNFISSVYKFLYKEYDYKPSISVEQFFTNIYLEKKLILCNDIIEIIIKSASGKPKKSLNVPSKYKDFDKGKGTQKNSAIGQDIDEELPQVKVVKENIPISGNISKQNKSNTETSNSKYSNNNNYDDNDEEEQPRTLNFQGAPKQQQISESGYSQQQQQQQQQQQRKQNIYVQDDHEEDQNKLYSQKQQYSQDLQSKVNNLKSELKSTSLEDQNAYLDSLKNDVQQKYSSMVDKFQKAGSSLNNQDQRNEEQEINSGSQRQRQSHEHDIPLAEKKVNNKQDRPVTTRELNEVMKLIMSLNQTMQETIHKLDQYQTSTNSKFQNINAQLMILEGEVKLLRTIDQNQ